MSDDECQVSAAPERETESASRIIAATFQLLLERGYAGTGTREIARRAKVSKRELYALFDSKEGILAAMIAGRATRMRQPPALPEAADRAGLAATLRLFALNLLREGSSPAVMALFRLAVAEAERAPGLAGQLDEHGRRPVRAALIALLGHARRRGLIAGAADVDTVASQFLALLWGDLQMRLLLRLAAPPSADEIETRAEAAVAAVLALYPAPLSRAG